MERLNKLFVAYVGHRPEKIYRLTPSGSPRSYFRLIYGDASYIGVYGTDADENRAFVSLSNHFKAKGINVPEVYSVSPDGMVYLQQDLGNVTLFDAMAVARKDGLYPHRSVDFLCSCLSQLLKMQFEGAEGLDFSLCYPEGSFNRRMIQFDLNYFKYCFLKPSGLEFNEVRLQDDFDAFAEDLLSIKEQAFMYRDFQSRNIMIYDEKPYFIDFQGGRKGPVIYDLASFVWQARADYPVQLREQLCNFYFDGLQKYVSIDRASFDNQLDMLVLFRALQVLGAYGFRGKIQKKSAFIESIPPVMRHVREILIKGSCPYLYLADVLENLAKLTPKPLSHDSKLEITIYSFAYKNGVPDDYSGNGGGYVFDCRAVHNPGKYERFANLTGLDKEVMDFLEDNKEILTFLKHINGLIDSHIDRYRQRGFNSLFIAFGCTGGRHRSAYCAQKTALRLSGTSGIRVHLIHRELGIDKYM